VAFDWQELHATHAADLRLLQEAKERERVLWEKEIDAALAHVKAGSSFCLCHRTNRFMWSPS
jgi:hypothetical protein